MKIAPVSADLIIKLALGLAAVGVVLYLGKKLYSVGGDLLEAGLDTAGDVLNSVNPTNPENVAYQTANVIGGEMAGDNPEAPGRNADGSWSFGGWIYDITH